MNLKTFALTYSVGGSYSATLVSAEEYDSEVTGDAGDGIILSTVYSPPLTTPPFWTDFKHSFEYIEDLP